MRTARFAAIAALCLLAACQTTHEIPPGRVIGEPIQPQETYRFSVVDAEPAKFFERTVLVEATVAAVCQKMGCWMQVADEGKTAMVRWESGCGGQYAFPKDAVGKRVLIQGTFYPVTMSADDVEHLEEEAGKKLGIP